MSASNRTSTRTSRTASTRGNAGTLLLLGILAIALGAGAILYMSRAKDRDVRDEVASLRHDAKVLDMKAEALLGDLANLRVERNVLREKLTGLETHARSNANIVDAPRNSPLYGDPGEPLRLGGGTQAPLDAISGISSS